MRIVFVALMVATAGAGQNLLVNGSFEQPGNDWWVGLREGSTFITGWVVTRDTVDYLTGSHACSDGKFCLDLDGTPGFGAIAQTFGTVSGATYTVAFDLAGNTDGLPVIKQLRVRAAGQQADFSFDTTGRSRTNPGWTTRSWSFTAAAAQTTIEFSSQDTVNGWAGPMLDNVRVTGATPPPPCTYSINPTTASAPAAGGAGTVAVTAAGGCVWTATSNAAWITITAGASGTGSGTVSYSVAASSSASSRSGTVTIAGQTFTITQAAGAATAPEPILSAHGVVNAADYRGVTAPGGMLAIFGKNLAPATRSASSLPLPTTLDGTSVDIYDGEAVRKAPLYFVSEGQINAQLPFEVTSPRVLVRVRTAGGESTAEALSVAARAPRLFTKSQDGAGEPLLLHADYSFVSETSPARPGEMLILYVAGMGEVRPFVATGGGGGDGGSLGALNVLTSPVTVRVGAQSVAAAFAGMAPRFAGLYQVNFVLPEETPAGWQSLRVGCANESSQGGVRFLVRTLPPPLADRAMGPAGGTVQAGAARLDVPAGVFSGAGRIRISETAGEAGESQLSSAYTVEGLPASFPGTVTLSIELERPPPAGEEVTAVVEYRTEDGSELLGSTLAPVPLQTVSQAGALGTKGGGPQPAQILRIALVSLPPCAVLFATAGPRPAFVAGCILSVSIAAGLVYTPPPSPGGSFRAQYSRLRLGISSAVVQRRLAHLERAARIVENEIGLKWGLQTGRPSEVNVLRFTGVKCDDNRADKWDTQAGARGGLLRGTAWKSALDINENCLQSLAGLTFADKAAGHELFHLYQGSHMWDYGTWPLANSHLRWISMREAASTWFERYYQFGGPETEYQAGPGPPESTKVFFDFLVKHGLEYRPTGDKPSDYTRRIVEARQHGYGAAMFLEYLVRKQSNPTILRDLFESWKRFPESPAAALNALTGGRASALWHEFCDQWMMSSVYQWNLAAPLGVLLPTPDQITQLAERPELDLRFGRSLPVTWKMGDLQARIFQVALPRDWTAAKKLKIAVTGPGPSAGVVVYSYLPGAPSPAWTRLKAFQGEAEIDDAGRLGSAGARLYVLVSSGYRGIAALGTDSEFTLSLGDPNLLPEMKPVKWMYTRISGDFRGAGIGLKGCSDADVDTRNTDLAGLPLLYNWGPPGPNGEPSRILFATGFGHLPAVPPSGVGEFYITVEFSEDGYSVLRAQSHLAITNAPRYGFNLTYAMKDLPFVGFVDYPSPANERVYTFYLANNAKPANLPAFSFSVTRDGQTGSSDGIDWQSRACLPRLSLVLAVPK